MESSKEEEENFLRVIKVLYGVAPQAVREKFHKYFPPDRWPGILNAEETMLRRQRRLTAKQISILFPSSGIPSSKNYDVTLMIYLLRNLTTVQPPSNGFDVLPPASEIHDGADLARIKYYRNRYAHFETDKLTSTDFRLIWEDITEAIVRLGGTSYQSVVDKIKSSVFNDEYLVHFREDLEATREELRDQITVSTVSTVKYVQEHIDKISSNFADICDENTEIKKAIQTVETRCNCYDAHELLIKEWENDDSYFVNTFDVNKMIKHIKLHYGILVIGKPGIGKSSTIQHIALHLRDEDDFAIIPCSNPSDIKQHYKKGMKQVFLIDDVCGRQCLNQNEVEEWIRQTHTIALILSQENVKILLSCRLQIYFETQFKRMTLLTQFTFDMSSETFSFEVRKRIARQYLSDDVVKKIKTFIKHQEFLPLLCKLGKYMKDENDVLDLFRNPYEHYKSYIHALSMERDKYKYIVLFLFVCSNYYIDDTFLMQRKIDLIFNHFGNGSLPITRLKEELNSLSRTYLLKTKHCTYKRIQNRQFEYLCSYFGETHQRELIRFADVAFVHENMYLECSNIIISDLCIKVNVENEEEYLSRLCTDWSNGHITDVFYSQQMESELFRSKFLFLFSKLDKKTKSELIETRDIGADCLMALHIVCMKGYVDLLEFMIESINSVTDFGDALNDVMNFSCVNGKLDVVKCLILHGASAKRVPDKQYPILCASFSGMKLFRNLISSLEHNPLSPEMLRNTNFLVTARKSLHVGLSTWLETCSFSFKDFAYLFSLVLGWNDEHRIAYLLAEDNVISRDISDALSRVMVREPDNQDFFILDYLLDNGADINESDEGGKSTLSYNCSLGYEKMVRYFVQNGANVNKGDNDGITPLHAAVIGGSTSVVSFLLDNGAIVNVCDNQRRTALWWAVKLFHPKVASLLLDQGIDVNQDDENRLTPLIVAITSKTYQPKNAISIEKGYLVMSSNEYMVKLLIQNGADVNKNESLLVAGELENLNIIDLLIDEGACINTRVNGKEIAFITYACLKKKISIVNLVLKKKVRFEHKYQALGFACFNGCIDIVNLLLSNDSDLIKKHSEDKLYGVDPTLCGVRSRF